MKLLSCEHPAQVKHPVTGETLFVPCGKCAACLNRRALMWQKRIEAECKSNKYGVFFELDFDEKHVVKLYRKDDCYVCASEGIVIPIEESSNWKESDYTFCFSQKYIRILSRRQMKLIFKRLRQIIERSPLISEGEKSIRYYYCGEYGPSTFRPHYHIIIWHNSDVLQRHLHDFICKAWQVGRCRAFKPVHDNAPQYIARYVTCTTDLPLILQNEQIKPFALSSRRPPIGTLPIYSEEVRKMFHSGSCRIAVENGKTGKVSLASLPRYYKDKLFPRLPLHGYFDSRLFYSLYQFPAKFESYNDFFEEVKNISLFGKYSPIQEYIKVLWNRSSKLQEQKYGFYFDVNDYPWHSFRVWYSLASLVNSLSSIYGVSLKDYVKKIVQFYNDEDYENLKDQLEFEEEYAKRRPLSHLLSIDPSYIKHLKECLDKDRLNGDNNYDNRLSEKDYMILSTYGVEPMVVCKNWYKIISTDLQDIPLEDWIEDTDFVKAFTQRCGNEKLVNWEIHFSNYYSYHCLDNYEYDIYNTIDYHQFCESEERIRVTNTKTKLNRDYLELLALKGDPRYKYVFEYQFEKKLETAHDPLIIDYWRSLRKVFFDNYSKNLQLNIRFD